MRRYKAKPWAGPCGWLNPGCRGAGRGPSADELVKQSAHLVTLPGRERKLERGPARGHSGFSCTPCVGYGRARAGPGKPGRGCHLLAWPLGPCCTLFFFLIFWPCRAARGISVPRLGMEPAPLAVEARSLNHWTAREVP